MRSRYVSAEQLARTTVPQFGYQLQFGSEDGQIERVVKDEASVRKFLKGMYGGRVKSGKRFMTPEKGVDLSIFEEEDDVGPSPLFDEEVCLSVPPEMVLCMLTRVPRSLSTTSKNSAKTASGDRAIGTAHERSITRTSSRCRPKSRQ